MDYAPTQSNTDFSMAGKIRTKEKCPNCAGKFRGEPLSCAPCKTHPEKYYIDLHRKGVRYRIFANRRSNPLNSWAGASRVLESIRYEIDNSTFDPTKYISADIKRFLFETRIDEWVKSKEKEVEKGNLSKNYTRGLNLFKDAYYLPFFKTMDVREIRAYDIQQFYEQLPDGKSLKYTKIILDALRNFFNILRRLDFVKEVPVFPIITIDRKVPKWIDRGTQMDIIGEIPETDRPPFLFMAFQGVRPGEALTFKVKDISFHDESFTIMRTYSYKSIRERVKSKVVKPRAINPVILDMLKGQCEGKHPEAFVFINHRTGKPYTYNYILKLWLRACEKKEITISLYQATRHSLASNLLKDGAALTAISDILGHTDIRTTLRYAHGDLASQRVAFGKQGGEVLPIRHQTVTESKTKSIKTIP